MRFLIFSVLTVFLAAAIAYLLHALTRYTMPHFLFVFFRYFFLIGGCVFLICLAYLFWHHAQFRMLPRTPYALLFVGLFPMSCLIAVFFLFLQDGLQIGYWLIEKITQQPVGDRRGFLLQTGLYVSTLPVFAGLTALGQAHDFQIHRVQVPLAHLPKAFRGFRIVQLSDIHIGSNWDAAAMQRAVELVLAQQPDLIVFTGDLVNNIALEIGEFAAVFAQLRAPFGVYSVLGNHDYGDYFAFDSSAQKQANLRELIRIQREEMGWNLLLNQSVVLSKGQDQIALIGIENWGLHGFAQYGDLAAAYACVREIPAKILLSHDPSHWRAQVCPDFPSIGLTLSGHTHGFQAGIETPYFRFSPVQFRYPEWAGLYQEADQYLYVNRGLGYIGFPGRVGIRPEITVIELVD